MDTYWRRADPGEVQDLEPAQLRKLVPFRFEDRFREQARARITVSTADCATLMGAMLRFGAEGDIDDDHAAWLAVEGADGWDRHDIGVLTPDEVATVAGFLSRVDPQAWMRRFWPDLARGASLIGYSHPFDDAWAEAVVTTTREVTELFGLAAQAGQAVIVMTVV